MGDGSIAGRTPTANNTAVAFDGRTSLWPVFQTVPHHLCPPEPAFFTTSRPSTHILLSTANCMPDYGRFKKKGMLSALRPYCSPPCYGAVFWF
ncbi:MAG: hypothetical protein KF770_14055 [Anaerolineae bacterium]|nr:hypothetical protein [Anaerolineae bacterium]